MSTLIYIQGALEPIETPEPFVASMTVLNGAMSSGFKFYQTRTTQGKGVAVCLDKITHIESLEVEGAE